MGLEFVVFMPAGAPWQKAGRRQSDAEHRWEMTRLAVDPVDYFVADDREVHRDGWTYTADTLATFDHGVDLTLILGADAALNLPTWERAAGVLKRVDLAVAPRSGTSLEAVERAVGNDLTWLDMAPLELSGTLVRQRVALGKPTRFLVPDSVWRYFTDQNLYTDAAAASVG